MPHASFKLVPGTDTNETEVLNENGGISNTNFIRFFYDRNGIALVQKLGGWIKYFSQPMVAVVRAIWAWQDLNITTHLAVGTTNYNSGGERTQLAVISGPANLADITPSSFTSNVAATFATTSGSPIVQIYDANALGIFASGTTVYIATQVSVGGVFLFGSYPIIATGDPYPTQYRITALDQLGNPVNATSSTGVAYLPLFTATSGSNIVVVNLPGYTYSVGDTFPVIIATVITGSGLSLEGNYVVQSLLDSSHFTITTATNATGDGTGYLNNNNVQYIYDNYPSNTPTPISALDWTLDNWGGDLVACPNGTNGPTASSVEIYQGIYIWSPGTPRATIIPQAPTVNDGVFVAMPQRQLVAWGSTETGIQDPLLIAWCDVSNYNQWIPLVTNQAGTYRIPKGSRIVGCVQGPQQAMIWTDIDAWAMQYIGPPYVYSFNEVGSGCGLIGRKAAASFNGIYYWMGPSQFYTLSSSGVQPLPCSVWDLVFQNLNQNYLQNIRVAVNSRFNEIQWFYPSTESLNGENDSYIKYNIVIGVWDYGSLGRSAWIDQSVIGPPIGADPTSLYLYQHETSNDADGGPIVATFRSGYFAIGEADVKSFVDWVFPDMKWSQFNQPEIAQVQLSFYVKDYPNDSPTVYGPVTMTSEMQYFYTRFRGKLVAIEITSSDLGSFWRLGLIRYRYAVDGRI